MNGLIIDETKSFDFCVKNGEVIVKGIDILVIPSDNILSKNNYEGNCFLKRVENAFAFYAY